MKIIFSPAKTFYLENPIDKDWDINDYTRKIVDVLETQSEQELKRVLKISDKLLAENRQYIEGFQDKKSWNALEMYRGMAYQSLDANSLDPSFRRYLEDHLLILSALYGPLKPGALVKPYRLDFHTSLRIQDQSLKDFWTPYYLRFFKSGEVIFNLASNEFSSLLDPKNYCWYDFDFFQWQGKEKKRHGTIAKKGRGRLLREMAIQGIKEVSEIKDLKGYGEYFSLISGQRDNTC